MVFIVTNIIRCSGNNHFTFTVQADGKEHTLQFEASDFTLEPRELREAFISRVRSAAKEAGATTFAQVRSILIGNEYKL